MVSAEIDLLEYRLKGCNWW